MLCLLAEMLLPEARDGGAPKQPPARPRPALRKAAVLLCVLMVPAIGPGFRAGSV